MADWQPIETAPEDVVVHTKIDDARGCRNHQNLKRMGWLWWSPDGSMYVYYTPTHWSPLNGTKTHPLSDYARGVLRALIEAPMPAQEVNPGAVNRLLRENLAAIVRLPSPYKTHNGKPIDHLQITDAGRANANQNKAER